MTAATGQFAEVVEGVVGHIVHVSFDQRTVLRLEVDRPTAGARIITATGKALFAAQPGENLRLTGAWVHHPYFGPQFAVRACERTQPTTVRAMRLYLASGLIRGIGPKLAAAIVDRFAADTLHVIDTDPRQLTAVRGIGAGRLARITEAWQEQKAIAEIMVFLQGLKISAGLAVKIYTAYQGSQNSPLDVVKRRPYQLIRDIHGVGFDTADKIALAVGIPKHSDERLQAALLHTLETAVGREGHCHLTERALLARTRQLLDDDDPHTPGILDLAVLRHALLVLDRRGEVVIENLALPVTGAHGADGCRDTLVVSMARMYKAETQLARGITRLLSAPSELTGRAPWAQVLGDLRGADTAGLTDEQYRAVLTVLTRTVSVLTGGPGCGKTHTLRTIVETAENAGAAVELAAPTGKAAKRLEETTGHPAQTVHRLLRPATQEGARRADHAGPLAGADIVVVDEASILDVKLAADLANAVRSGCHLLLVGDTDQLPSVGPGRVLHDLLAVPAIPRTRLTRVFRQRNESAAIITGAHRILRGLMPQPAPGVFGCDLATARPGDLPLLADAVVACVADRIPRAFGVTPADIQVLCPGKKNPAGMSDLNLRLQARLNPPAPDKPEHHADGRIYRLGDRVLHIRNTPHRGRDGIFNGATGTITAVTPDQHHLTVTYPDGEDVLYPYIDAADELLHSWALTVHRSQGSEYPYVVIPITTAAGILLQRNLLYTAVTRAVRGVLLIGHTTAVTTALANTRVNHRNTALSTRITTPAQTPGTQQLSLPTTTTGQRQEVYTSVHE